MTRALALIFALSGAVPASGQDADFGERLYVSFCASCHGLEGEGDGPMSGFLEVEPTDLTRFASRNQGRFPVTAIVRQIDGRDPMLAHGGVMPLFGEYFDGMDASIKTETGQPIVTSGPIADLVTWLETIQD